MVTKTESIDLAQQTLCDSYSAKRYLHLRQLQYRLLGIDDEVSDNRQGHSFIWFPSIQRTSDDYEKPNRILNNVRLLTSQTRTVEIAPQWTNINSEIKVQARESFWAQRSQGIGGYGGWKDDLDRAFMDFAGLGIGVLRCAVKSDGEYDRVCALYRSPLHCGVDPYVPSPEDSDWYWDADLWSIPQLKERWGDKEDWEAYCDSKLQGDIVYKAAVVIEFFNKNPDNGMPGYMAMLRSFDGEVIESSENPFGSITPATFFCNFVPPGAMYPVGLVETQSYAVKRLSELDDIIKEIADRISQVMVDSELLDQTTWKRLQNGENPRFIPFGDGWDASARQTERVPFMELPRVNVPADIWQERQFWEQYLRESSGVTSSMAGIIAPENRTAFEVNNVAQQSAAQVSFLSREYARGYQSFASKIATVAEMYDNAPFYASIAGVEVEFNDGEDIQTTSETIWKGAKTAVIGEELLINTDVNAKRQMEGLKWKEIFALTKNPEAIKGYLESQGIKEVDKYMPVAPPAMPGQPPQDLGAIVA